MSIPLRGGNAFATAQKGRGMWVSRTVLAGVLLLASSNLFRQALGTGVEDDAQLTELKRLERLANDPTVDPQQVWKTLTALRQRAPGSKVAVRVTQLLSEVRSPLDTLNSKHIPASEFVGGSPSSCVAVLGEHRGRTWGEGRGLALSPDGKLIASEGAGVCLWDSRLLRLRGVLPACNRPAFSPDGKLLAVVEPYADGPHQACIRLYDVTGPSPVHRYFLYKEGSWVLRFNFTPNGKGLVVLNLDRQTDEVYRLWHLDRDKPQVRELARIKQHTVPSERICFSPDNTRLITAEAHKLVQRRMDKEPGPLEVLADARNGIFALSPDGKRVVTCQENGLLCLWNFGDTTVTEPYPFERHDASNLNFSPDGKLLVGVHWDSLKVWTLDDIARAQREKVKLAAPRAVKLPFQPRHYSFFPDGRLVFLARDGSVRLWDLDKNKELLPSKGSCGEIVSLAFSPQGDSLVSAGADGSLRFWNLAGEKPQETFVAWHDDVLKSSDRVVSFSPRGGALAVLAKRPGGWQMEVQWWDLRGKIPKRGPVVPALEGFLNSRAHNALQFDPSGEHLLFLGSQQPKDRLDSTKVESAAVLVWALNADNTVKDQRCHVLGISTKSPYPNSVWGATFAQDGRHWLAIVDGEVRLMDWPAPQVKQRAMLLAHSFPCGLAYSPDGTELATCGLSDAEGADTGKDIPRIRFWSLDGNRFKQTRSLTTERAFRVEYALGGSAILTQEGNWACVLRDKSTGKILYRWQAPAGGTTLALAPDGRHLALGNANGTIYIVRLKELPKR